MSKLLVFAAGVVTGTTLAFYLILEEKIIVSYNLDGGVSIKSKEDQPS